MQNKILPTKRLDITEKSTRSRAFFMSVLHQTVSREGYLHQTVSAQDIFVLPFLISFP